MTNSEIIEGLKALRTIHNGNYAPYVDEAIKRLSAEPCDYYISIQQAIDKMQELEDEDIKAYGCSIPEGFDGRRAIEALKTLDPVIPKAKDVWIPVSSGRLPINSDEVLVWFEFIKDDYDCAWWGTASYSAKCKKWVVFTNEHNPVVKAWMPLPESYEAESEDKE